MTSPLGWTRMALSDLMGSSLFTDGDWIETKDQDPIGGIRLIQLADVGEGHFRDRSSRFVNHETAERLGCTFLKPGDVLVARMPEPLGRSCLMPATLGIPSITAVDVCILRPDSSTVDAAWLMWILNAPQSRQQVLALQSGTTRKRISRKNLATVSLDVPPLPEQRRIRDAIEEQFSRLDAAKESLHQTLAKVEVYGHAILEAIASAGGSWPVAPLRDVATWGSGGTPKATNRAFYGGGIPWAVIGDLNDGVVYETRSTITEEGLARSSAKIVEPGTVMVAMYGSIGRVGVAGVRMATNQAIAWAIPRSEIIERDYLLWFLRSQRNRFRAAARGTTQGNISQTILKEWPVPVPTPDRQREAVTEMERHYSLMHEMQQEILVASSRSETLRKVILREAFAGRLVPQDLADRLAMEPLGEGVRQ